MAPLAISLLLVGCSDGEQKATNDTDSKTNSTEESGPYTVVDDRGQEVTFEEVPEKIVSLQPSNTEILFELGVGDQIIGASEYDTYPEEALKIERVTDSMTVNTERIIELNPDVVFAYTTGEEAQIDQLESAGLKVFVIQSATSINDVYGDIEQMAEVMGVEEEGKQVVEDIQSQIAAVQEKTKSIEQKKKFILKFHQLQTFGLSVLVHSNKK